MPGCVVYCDFARAQQLRHNIFLCGCTFACNNEAENTAVHRPNGSAIAYRLQSSKYSEFLIACIAPLVMYACAAPSGRIRAAIVVSTLFIFFIFYISDAA